MLYQGNQIISALHRLSKAGTAIIYVGHYMSEIEELCDYICLLDNGRWSLITDMDKALIRDEKKITLEELYNTVKGDADSREQERDKKNSFRCANTLGRREFKGNGSCQNHRIC